MESSDHDPAFHAPSIEELQPLFPAYEISGFIAQGGMGAVYLANQISLDRPVAIKILPRQFGENPQFRTSFESEAKAMARLNHPNLIGVYDFGDVDGMLYIIMEFVEGKSLYHSAYGKAIDQKEAARIVAAICHALAHAHHAGILHRDIKPSNILLGPGAVPKIGDFGLARPAGEGHDPNEIVWGTPGYTAPEVVNTPDAVDHRADIFSVGVLLYELLTGHIPQDGWQPPSAEVRSNPGFDAIVRRAMDADPKKRYPDAEDLAKELDTLITKIDGPALLRTASGASPGAARPVTTARPILSPTKSKTGPVLIVVLLIAVIAVGGIIMANLGKKDKPTGKPADVPPAPVVNPKPKPKDKPKPRVAKDDRPKRDPKKDKPKDKPTDPDPREPKPEPEPEQVESTTQALARLQAKLKSGDLTELPKGAAKHGDSHFLLVDAPMSWTGAAKFAEDHGAQLAVLESKDDLAWAAGEFKVKAPAWLGLSDSGTEGKWNWINGAPPKEELWAAGQPDDTPSKDDGEDFAALLSGSILDDQPASRELSFLLQWSADGSNEGSLAKQLKRTGEALKAKRAPVFPAGTRNLGGSRFLSVPQAVSWDEASAIATAAGGHLAVPSSQAEADWIMNTLRTSLGEGESCWVGGRQSGTQWTFVTGEKFDFIEWAADQPDELDQPQPCLQVWRSGEGGGAFGYDNALAANDTMVSFLVEWSVTSKRNMPTKEDMAQNVGAPEWLIAHRQKTADRNKVSYSRFKRRWDKNVEDFVDDIQSEVDSARRQEMRILEKMAEEFIKKIEEDGKIPEEIDPGAKRLIGDIHEDALEKQNEIWENYEPDFDDALERYLEQIEDQIKRLGRIADREGSDYLNREWKATSDKPDRFNKILNGEFPPVPEEDAGEDGEDTDKGDDEEKDKASEE